jgi:hypothetical protein
VEDLFPLLQFRCPLPVDEDLSYVAQDSPDATLSPCVEDSFISRGAFLCMVVLYQDGKEVLFCLRHLKQ